MQTKKYFIEKNVAHAQFRKCSLLDPSISTQHCSCSTQRGKRHLLRKLNKMFLRKKESETNNLEDVCFSYTLYLSCNNYDIDLCRKLVACFFLLDGFSLCRTFTDQIEGNQGYCRPSRVSSGKSSLRALFFDKS